MRTRRIVRRTHFAPLSDAQTAAIVDDRDYVSKVIGASPAICFQFTHMENEASIRRIIDDKREFLGMGSFDITINESYSRTKVRSEKQRAAGRRWQARINGDGDKIHGYDDGEYMPQYRVYAE